MAYTPDRIFPLFLVKRTQVEMLADRGLNIPDDEIRLFLEDPNALQPTDELFTAFIQRYTPTGGIFSREALTQTYRDDQDRITYVYFAPTIVKTKQGSETVKIFLNAATTLGAETAIIVTGEDFTSDARKALEEVTSPRIQIFFDHQLYANPTAHVMVPRHTKLTDEERTAFLTKYRLSPGQILNISIDDPVVRYYGWRTGNLIRIDRTNLGTNRTMVRHSIAYRMVSRTKIEPLKKPTKPKDKK